MQRGLPSRTVTFVFTDVVGSTQLLRQLGSRYADALSEHRDLIRKTFAADGGHEIDTQGDSFFYVFASARAAVLASAGAQRALANHPWPESGVLTVRMGVHSGPAQLADGRYIGLAVHRAARIGAAARGGQILLSGTTQHLLEDEEPILDLGVRDVGSFRLKDFQGPVRLYEISGQGLGGDRPDAEPVRDGRRPLALALIGAAVVVGAGIAVLALSRGGAKAIAVRANSLAVIDADSDRVDDDVTVGLQPGPLAFGDGAVWVGNIGDSTLSKVDARSGSVERTISLGATPGDVTTSPGWIWATLDESKELVKIAPLDGAVEQRVPLPATGGAHVIPVTANTHDAFGGGAIWVSEGFNLGGSPSDSNVFRFAAPRRRAVLIAHPATEVAGIAYGYDSVWATGRSDNTLLQLSPITGRIADTSTVGESPGAVAVGDGAIWVVSSLDGTVSQFVVAEAGSAPSLKAVIQVGKSPVAVAVGGGAVWVANSGDGTVSRIDPASSKVVRTIRVGQAPAGIAVGTGRVWVAVDAPAPY